MDVYTDPFSVQRGFHVFLRDLATLNDVQYQRYRLAFKFRKLQKSLHLEYGNVSMLSEVLHLTGIQTLHHRDVVPFSQLSSVLTELYEAIRTTRPVLSQLQLQDAQDWAYSWFQVAYKEGSIEVINLKIILCLFMGSKVADKARFIFGQLANANGTIEREEMKRFIRVLRELAHAVQENVDYQSLDKIFQECLISVRDSKDIEDEQLDGGIRRQWLSQFEFTKLLSSSSSPSFLSWFILWFQLPTYENVVHAVRCSICARKPIVCFRYQCTQCHNYHMCQMCFLKGRTSDKHQISHKVLEFSNKGRGSSSSWHSRLLGKRAAMGGRLMTEERLLFSLTAAERQQHSRSQSVDDDIDTAPVMQLKDMIKTAEFPPFSNGKRQGSHAPAMIRIGSDSKISSSSSTSKKSPPRNPSNSVVTETVPTTHTLHTSPARRVSSTVSGSSSPDSLSSNGGTAAGGTSAGGKFSFEGARMSRGSPQHLAVQPTLELRRGFKQTVSDSTVTMGTSKKKDLTEVNRRLSHEVDQILMDLPSPPTNHYSTASLPLRGHTHSLGGLPYIDRHGDSSLQSNLEGIHKEEKELKVQVSQLTDKREKMSHELHDLISQVQQMQVGFQTLGHRKQATSSWARLMSPPSSFHTRSDSAPVQSPSPTSSSPESSLPPVNETEVSPEPTALVTRHKKEREPDGYRARVYTPESTTAMYHDPLSEFHAGTEPDTLKIHKAADHRLSVAW